MKKYSLLILLLSALCSLPAYAQRHVSQERMAEVYEEAKTPYKYGLVVAPSTNDAKIDCPTVFRDGDKWYMTYVIYDGRGAKDGRGYETWLAESDNLLEWRTLGRVLPWRDGMWDANQRAGFPALVDMEWGGSYALQRYKGRAWMSYFGGTGRGYEAIEAPLSIGVAWTKDDPATAHAWESGKKPVLTHDEKDAQWWERLTHYKTMVYWDKDETLGAPFVMYYNAGGVNPETGFKGERIGIALSKNMKKWRRYEGNPVFSHEAQGTITGDAQIVKMGDVYVMFYFSAFNPSRPYKAYNTFACSYDLVTWDDCRARTSSTRPSPTTRCLPIRVTSSSTTEWSITSIVPSTMPNSGASPWPRAARWAVRRCISPSVPRRDAARSWPSTATGRHGSSPRMADGPRNTPSTSPTTGMTTMATASLRTATCMGRRATARSSRFRPSRRANAISFASRGWGRMPPYASTATTWAVTPSDARC